MTPVPPKAIEAFAAEAERRYGASRVPLDTGTLDRAGENGGEYVIRSGP